MKRLLRSVLLSFAVLLPLSFYLAAACEDSEIAILEETRHPSRKIIFDSRPLHVLSGSFATDRPARDRYELGNLRKSYPTPRVDPQTQICRELRWEVSEDGLTHTWIMQIENVGESP